MALLDLFETGNLESNFKQYKHIYEIAFFYVPINSDSHKSFFESCIDLRTAIVEICRILLNNYNIYSEKVWDTSEKEINKAVYELNRILSETDHARKWEKELGCKYKYDNFFAVICNSIENGPQAIDISYNKDVFCLPKDYIAAVNLISHEFGIYLLKDVLADTQAFKDFSCYQITESLAEYFNRTITGGHGKFD